MKQVRLVANLAISPETGVEIARQESIAESLTSILELCGIPMRRGAADLAAVGGGGAGAPADAAAAAAPGGGAAEEELVLNAVSAVTNITYYDLDGAAGDAGGEANHLFARSERLGPRLLSLLFCENDEAVVEAARAIGNVTRDDRTRARMAASTAAGPRDGGGPGGHGASAVGRATLEALVILLEHGNRDVVYAVVGCLMNLAADAGCYRVLGELGCERQLIDALAWSVLNDVEIACVVMKALYNFRLCRRTGGDGDGDGDEDEDDEHEEVAKAQAILEILDRVPPPDTKLSGSPSEEEDPEAVRAAGSLWALGRQLGKKVHAVLDRAMEGSGGADELEPL